MIFLKTFYYHRRRQSMMTTWVELRRTDRSFLAPQS